MSVLLLHALVITSRGHWALLFIEDVTHGGVCWKGAIGSPASASVHDRPVSGGAAPAVFPDGCSRASR